MVNTLLSEANGAMEIHWPSNTFASIWKLQWNKDCLTIDSDWSCVIGGTEKLLTMVGNLQLSRIEFIAEWKKLLVIVADALRQSGYTEAQIGEMRELKDVIAKIPSFGLLYR